MRVIKSETENNFYTVENASNGYIEGIKLEGKTLVNLCDRYSDKNYSPKGLFYRQGSSTVNYDYNTLYGCKLFLNPNGNTSLAFDSSRICDIGKIYTAKFTFNNQTNQKLNLMYSPTGYKEEGGFTIGSVDAYSKEDFCFTFIATDTNRIAHNLIVGSSTSEFVEFSNMVILEGDHTDKPISYFEGIKSVGQGVSEISVLSTGHNEFNVLGNGHSEKTIYAFTNNDTDEFLDKIIPYVKYFNNVGSYDKCNNLFDYYFTDGDINVWLNLGSFNREEALINLNCKIAEINKKQDKKRILYYNSDTKAWEKPVLREWDTIEKHSDGKYYYHKRSGEVVLNGGETWVDSTIGNGLITRYIPLNDMKRAWDYSNIILCDKFKVLSSNSIEQEGISAYSNLSDYVGQNWLYLNTKIGTDELKQWLQSNNVTVVYQLAEEKVYECTNLDLITYAYETNYIVNTGAIVPKSSFNVSGDISNVVALLQKNVTDGNTHEHEYQKHKLSHHNGNSFEVGNGDLNEITKTGWYSVVNCENSPISSDLWGILEVVTHAHGENFVLQRFTQLLGSTVPPSYYRLKIGEGRWLGWQKITTTLTASVSDYSLRGNDLTENEILTESIISLEDRIIELEDEVDTLKQQLAILTSRLDNLENK